ncbi:MAG: asparagine synthetase B, partial [Thermodesulfobacteriota bacterium]|nr:asparagine synthetase B [Thermodesulfobacteriota bacterium]
MCGIVGIWGSTDEACVKKMMDFLVHRGPDAEGLYTIPLDTGVIGHRRLSIIDPQGGNQPIFGEDGSVAIIANGEIYNFRQLLHDLSPSHQFHTTSDSEAILHLYEDKGTSTVDYLDGMYAFAISDGQSLFVAR